MRQRTDPRARIKRKGKGKGSNSITYVLVRNDLDVLNMAGRLENLAQDVFCDAGVQASNIQSTLVRLRSSAATERAAAGRRHNAALVAASAHRRGDRGRDRVRVLRDVQRGRRHVGGVRGSVLAVLVAWSTGVRLGRGRQLTRGRGRSVVSHIEASRSEEVAWWKSARSRQRMEEMAQGFLGSAKTPLRRRLRRKVLICSATEIPGDAALPGWENEKKKREKKAALQAREFFL